MQGFQARRVHYEYTQVNDAPPERVFPLLCPVREQEWVPEWRYRLICSQSGVAEAGCVFATPNDDGSETVWVVTEYDPAGFCIALVWVWPGMIACQIQIRLTAQEPGQTRAHICYLYTGLAPEGNAEIARYTCQWFENKMESWQGAINHYLRTGRILAASGRA